MKEIKEIKEIVETIVVAMVALAVIALTGWVFYLTRNPLSFLIPLTMPLLSQARKHESEEQE